MVGPVGRMWRWGIARRRLLLWSAAAVAVIVGAGIVTALVWPQQDDNAVGAEAIVVRTADDPAEESRLAAATQMVQALPGHLAAGDAGDLAASTVDRFRDVRAALPAGTTLEVDGRSWHRTGAIASLTVTAVTPGKPRVRFVIVLALEGGAWKVTSTVPLGPAS